MSMVLEESNKKVAFEQEETNIALKVIASSSHSQLSPFSSSISAFRLTLYNNRKGRLVLIDYPAQHDYKLAAKPVHQSAALVSSSSTGFRSIDSTSFMIHNMSQRRILIRKEVTTGAKVIK